LLSLMIDAITTTHYAGEQIHGVSAELAQLERMTGDTGDQVPAGWGAGICWPGSRAITAAIAGRLVGFLMCQPGEAENGLEFIPGQEHLSAGRWDTFTRAAMRVLAPVVAPAAADLGVGAILLDAARLEQPDGRMFALLPAGHPGNRATRALGWHEVARSRSGTQLLVHPDHPALAGILLPA
jgi:hypothetical protein